MAMPVNNTPASAKPCASSDPSDPDPDSRKNQNNKSLMSDSPNLLSCHPSDYHIPIVQQCCSLMLVLMLIPNARTRSAIDLTIFHPRCRSLRAFPLLATLGGNECISKLRCPASHDDSSIPKATNCPAGPRMTRVATGRGSTSHPRLRTIGKSQCWRPDLESCTRDSV